MTRNNGGRRSTFERRHYRSIAEAIKAARARSYDSAAIGDLQQDLAEMFARDNSNFQRATFNCACSPLAPDVRQMLDVLYVEAVAALDKRGTP